MSPATAKMAGTARLARMNHHVTAHKHAQGADGGPAAGRRSAPVAAKAAAINAEQQRPLTWKTVIKRALVVAVAGMAIYLVLPSLAAVLGSWPRDTIRTVLGGKWWQAALLTAGRLGFDYGCLLAALRATGTSPRPSLVLLAYSAAGIIALFPLTPGGLGIVEASLSGLLILAGVHAGDAFLATLAYRIASYWLPLLAGPPAYLLFRHRYGTPATRPADHQGANADPEHRPRAKGTTA